MKLTKERLVSLIEEELEKVDKERKRERHKLNRERSRAYRGGELMSLAHGIAEDDSEDDKKSKRTGAYKDCKGAGNQYHDSDGKLSSKGDAASNSLYFSCPEYPFRTGKGMRAVSDPADSGRGKNKHKGKGRYRVKDNQPLWEDLEDEAEEVRDTNDIKLDSLYLRNIVRQELAKFSKALAQDNKGQGGCTFPKVLDVMKQWKSAEQFKPPKPK
tara:strand:+ start:225 stop:866 length:642 start_codon:yes stop_codon:yes gene_type:complete